MDRILIVEDEWMTAARIERFLKREGFDIVGIAVSDREVYRIIRQEKVDLILMDIRLEGSTDGVEIARVLRRDFRVPILFLTAMEQIDIEAILVMEQTDFLNKPWQETELLFAIQKLLRGTAASDRLNLGDGFSYSFSKRELTRKGELIHLDMKQRDLLELLLRYRGTLVTHEVIEYHVWPEGTVTNSTRMALISKLRKNLNGKFVRTVYREGYILDIP